MTERFTKRNALDILLTLDEVKADPRLVDYVKNEIELLDKKKNSVSKADKAKAEARGKIAEIVLEILAEAPADGYTVTQMLAVGKLPVDTSTSMVSYLLSPRGEIHDKVVKTIIKGKPYYKLVEEA